MALVDLPEAVHWSGRRYVRDSSGLPFRPIQISDFRLQTFRFKIRVA
jgi:hypothetical protein